VSVALEAGLYLTIASSAAAFGAVHPENYRWLWLCGLLLGMLALVRAWLAARLRRTLGSRLIVLDEDGRWRGLEARPAPRPRWSAELGPLAGQAPLLLPGALFGAWALLQLAPLPSGFVRVVSPGRAAFAFVPAGSWLPLTVAPAETARGLAFLATALLVHLAAAAAMASAGSRERLLRGLALWGLALALLGLVQLSLGVERIYGVFAPLEGGGALFGPFVNRNHFAGYMLMVIPAALAVAVRAFRRYAAAVGREGGWRARLLALDTRAGASLVAWSVPALAATVALLATQSRGGLLAFLIGLVVLAAGLRRRALLGLAALALAALVAGQPLAGLQDRFMRTSEESLLRTRMWTDALERSRGMRWAGVGFNSYATALTRTDAWALPEGATGWPPGASPAEILGARGGFRLHADLADGRWYRELHNDYLQVLVETGVPGLLFALWGAAAVLLSARGDAWILAALAGVLFHELVDFDLQIPALAVLFVTLAAAPARPQESLARARRAA
jgi:O-antigen ligase